MFFPKMVHLTRLVHTMHRVAEGIRVAFPQGDLLVFNRRKVLMKAPSRIAVFRDGAPDLHLPPQHV